MVWGSFGAGRKIFFVVTVAAIIHFLLGRVEFGVKIWMADEKTKEEELLPGRHEGPAD